MLIFENRVNDFWMNYHCNFDFLPHLHHNLEILVCTEGVFGVSCNGKSAELRPGDLMIAFSNQVHSYHDIGAAKGIMIIVNPRQFSLISTKLENRDYENFLTNQGDFYIRLAQAAYTEYSGKASTAIMTGYLYVLLGNVLRTLPYRPQNTPVTINSFSQALEYISDNFTGKLSLRAVAQNVGIDPCHLSRMFKQRTGYGYLQYLHLLRITYAKDLLRNSNKKITEIAMESGFCDQKTFNRVFKELTGVTPKTYRVLLQRDKTACIHL